MPTGSNCTSKVYILIVALAVSTAMSGAASPPFIHVYDMPATFTKGVLSMRLDEQQHPWARWYNTDQASSTSHR